MQNVNSGETVVIAAATLLAVAAAFIVAEGIRFYAWLRSFRKVQQAMGEDCFAEHHEAMFLSLHSRSLRGPSLHEHPETGRRHAAAR